MENRKWHFYDQDALGHRGQTMRQVLETAFWDSLWSEVSQVYQRQDLERAFKDALKIVVMNTAR